MPELRHSRMMQKSKVGTEIRIDLENCSKSNFVENSNRGCQMDVLRDIGKLSCDNGISMITSKKLNDQREDQHCIHIKANADLNKLIGYNHSMLDLVKHSVVIASSQMNTDPSARKCILISNLMESPTQNNQHRLDDIN
ncbi:hypothetical protein GJ496_001062 [Pomphorhynchus laevis]|nr:hypothetical protein GJ496_001062 [Pomphorhynchus laevis]